MAYTNWATSDLITAAKLNNDNSVSVGTDTARTITVTHTWTASQTFTGGWTAAAACTVTVASATAFAVGRQGATDPALLVHSSTASQATGIQITGKAAASGAAIAVISSGTNENLTIDAKGSGSITLGGTSTGAIVLTRGTTLSAALTYGGVTLSNAVTGTGNMVLSASPTFTGTINASGALFGGLVGLPDGSASAPAIYQASNTDVGIYFASSELSVTINNSTKLSVGASGIAIGNTVNAVSPTSPNRTITMVIGGTTYYLHAKTTND